MENIKENRDIILTKINNTHKKSFFKNSIPPEIETSAKAAVDKVAAVINAVVVKSNLRIAYPLVIKIFYHRKPSSLAQFPPWKLQLKLLLAIIL